VKLHIYVFVFMCTSHFEDTGREGEPVVPSSSHVSFLGLGMGKWIHDKDYSY
jgi:hypothetical protein